MNKIFLSLIIFISGATFAQVTLEINEGMTVETTGGLAIEISGDLIENGTGYLKGKVTTGDRSGSGGVSSFAGLDLNGISVDQVTRNTGSDYNGDTAPSTVFRNYEIISSSAISPDIDFAFLNGGDNNEANGLNEKYIYSYDNYGWKGYSDNGSTSSLVKASSVDIVSGKTYITLTEGVGLDARIYLEGPYNSGSMGDKLGNLPSTSPYMEALRTASNIPTNAVDWVLLEIRTGTAANTLAGYRSAFVDIHGEIINDLGETTGIGIPGVDGINYYIIVKHRNHLSIMSSSTKMLNWLTP